MKDDKHLEKEQDRESQKNLIGFFFRRNKFDKTYAPDLKQQWGGMDRKDRRKFIIGVIVGFVIFIISIALLFILMSNLIHF